MHDGIVIVIVPLPNADRVRYSVSFSTVHPDGIPDVPVGNDVIEGAFTNVPVAATPLTQLSKQFEAEIFVANIVILLSLLQPENMS